jgi:hypothetical protein
VLKNSLARLPAAIFESRRPVCQLFITLLGENMNQSFTVYPPPLTFSTISSKDHVNEEEDTGFGCATILRRKSWKRCTINSSGASRGRRRAAATRNVWYGALSRQRQGLPMPDRRRGRAGHWAARHPHSRSLVQLFGGLVIVNASERTPALGGGYRSHGGRGPSRRQSASCRDCCANSR